MIITAKNNILPKAIIAIAAVITATITGVALLQDTSQAADLSKFDPGNIMSDAVMSDKNSMNVQQIQAFLDSKNRCNNTNIHMASWYPNLKYTIKDGKFVCMAKDTFDGQSAAQVIWQVSQDYGINPQFLIVLLEKEQGLVTDTWPNHRQYQTATGYGCPDTAACDSKYFGLKNQLQNAASLFRTVLNGGWSNYPVGQTYVQYHPNSWCGGSFINIQNRATSALYRYTPYQPNPSALAAGYGTGDSCGAYGNRNTYALFTDWFGSSTQPRWQPLVDARVMSVKQDTKKLNINTNSLDSSILRKGQQLKFTSKTDLANGNACLRTEEDTTAKNLLCVPITELSELSIEYQEVDEYRAISAFTCPVDLRRSEARCDKQSAVAGVGQQINPGAKTVVRGVEYYVSDYKSSPTSEGMGIRADRTRSSYKFTDIPKEILKTVRMTNKISHIDSRTLDQPINSSELISVSQKVVVNGTVYYRTTHDMNANLDRVILAERMTPVFEKFIQPRNLETIKQAISENPLTGEVCAVIKSGTTTFFSSKGEFNGTLYFRTDNMTKTASMCAIKASSLKEV